MSHQAARTPYIMHYSLLLIYAACRQPCPSVPAPSALHPCHPSWHLPSSSGIAPACHVTSASSLSSWAGVRIGSKHWPAPSPEAGLQSNVAQCIGMMALTTIRLADRHPFMPWLG